MIEELRAAGLTENESKVYLALVDLGPSLAGKISRRSGLHRRTVYDTTEMLIKKGLVGYIVKNNRKNFQASNPHRLLEILKEKELSLEPMVDKLMEKFSSSVEKEETNFYKGIEGLKTVFEDQLSYKEILVLGASTNAYELLEFYFHWYDIKRKTQKIKMRIISSSRNIKRVPLAEIKYLPEKYANPVAVNIYGDKVAIILWAKEKPFAILIKNKDVADGYKNYFELMWNIAER
jgi:sugar-specific transcriptional regulator TrmB